MSEDRGHMLGFIGAGSMSGAIIRGGIARGAIDPSETLFYRRDDESATAFSAETGLRRAASNRDLVAQLNAGDIVVIGVKPYAVPEILQEIAAPARERGNVIVSVAAGTTIESMARILPSEQPIVRTMPNVNAQIGMSMTALCPNEYVTSAQLQLVQNLFTAIGETVLIEEKDFATFSAIAGCSPAWTFTYIDALSRGALAQGMPKKEAVRIAAQAVLGSAQLVLNKLDSTTPANLVDTVTSPGGTTIAGLVAMENAGFTNSVIAGINGAVQRDKELAVH